MKVLIVDDSATMRAILKKTLTMCSIGIEEILQAKNGQEGLDVLKKNHVDLVMADINMPVMSGLQMIEKIREIPELAETPILVVSSDSSDTRKDELTSKSVRYVRKPFTPEAIADEINALIEEKQHAD